VGLLTCSDGSGSGQAQGSGSRPAGIAQVAGLPTDGMHGDITARYLALGARAASPATLGLHAPTPCISAPLQPGNDPLSPPQQHTRVQMQHAVGNTSGASGLLQQLRQHQQQQQAAGGVHHTLTHPLLTSPTSPSTTSTLGSHTGLLPAALPISPAPLPPPLPEGHGAPATQAANAATVIAPTNDAAMLPPSTMPPGWCPHPLCPVVALPVVSELGTEAGHDSPSRAQQLHSIMWVEME
jgi:hypothetical protein